MAAVALPATVRPVVALPAATPSVAPGRDRRPSPVLARGASGPPTHVRRRRASMCAGVGPRRTTATLSIVGGVAGALIVAAAVDLVGAPAGHVAPPRRLTRQRWPFFTSRPPGRGPPSRRAPRVVLRCVLGRFPCAPRPWNDGGGRRFRCVAGLTSRHPASGRLTWWRRTSGRLSWARPTGILRTVPVGRALPVWPVRFPGERCEVDPPPRPEPVRPLPPLELPLPPPPRYAAVPRCRRSSRVDGSRLLLLLLRTGLGPPLPRLSCCEATTGLLRRSAAARRQRTVPGSPTHQRAPGATFAWRSRHRLILEARRSPRSPTSPRGRGRSR